MRASKVKMGKKRRINERQVIHVRRKLVTVLGKQYAYYVIVDKRYAPERLRNMPESVRKSLMKKFLRVVIEAPSPIWETIANRLPEPYRESAYENREVDIYA